jgi:hypothetical protein
VRYSWFFTAVAKNAPNRPFDIKVPNDRLKNAMTEAQTMQGDVNNIEHR